MTQSIPQLQAAYTGPWKQGDEFLPFHPQASHIGPDYRDGWNAGYWAALSQPMGVAGIPPGMALVPIEPTDEMVRAAFHQDLSYMPGHEGPDRAAVYRLMVAAAPQPQAVQQDRQGGWQPIETAPAEGVFLVFMPTEREGKRIQPMLRRKNFSTIGDRFDFDCEPPTLWQEMPAAPSIGTPTKGVDHG